MSEISNPHDRFFKAVFGRPDVAADFLTHYLPPDVAAALNLRTLELTKDSFIDAELQEHLSDLLYRVRLKRGGAAFVYLLFEHKSGPEELVAFQLLRYKVRIWEPLAQKRPVQKLPPIFPLVLYHGRTRWRIPHNFGALIKWEGAEALRKYVDEFEYHLLDFSAFSKTEIVGAAFAYVALLVLRYAFTGELLERLPEIVRLLPLRERDALEYLATVMRYVSEVTRPLTRDEYGELKEQLPTETGELMETMASAWIKEGRQKGRQEAAAAITLRLLQRQIGTVSERMQARLRKLSFEQLEELSEALLTFKSPRDLTAWLHAHLGKAP